MAWLVLSYKSFAFVYHDLDDMVGLLFIRVMFVYHDLNGMVGSFS